jgi:hypothetical protein
VPWTFVQTADYSETQKERQREPVSQLAVEPPETRDRTSVPSDVP